MRWAHPRGCDPSEPGDRPSRPSALLHLLQHLTKADEYIRRVQIARKQIALNEGKEAYVLVSSLFTNGCNQFRYNLDKVMELEKRSLETIAEPGVLAARIDMTLNHDRLDAITQIKNPSLVVGTRRRDRALLLLRRSPRGH